LKRSTEGEALGIAQQERMSVVVEGQTLNIVMEYHSLLRSNGRWHGVTQVELG
jgi:hypothetical protein